MEHTFSLFLYPMTGIGLCMYNKWKLNRSILHFQLSTHTIMNYFLPCRNWGTYQKLVKIVKQIFWKTYYVKSFSDKLSSSFFLKSDFMPLDVHKRKKLIEVGKNLTEVSIFKKTNRMSKVITRWHKSQNNRMASESLVQT